MNKTLAKNLVYYPIQVLRGEKVRKYLPEVKGIERLPLERIKELQLTKLMEVIDYSSKNIPFYRELFDSRGIRPEDIGTYSDLMKIPVLTKRTILENEKRLINPSFMEKMRVRKTGGSTGMTLHFMKERNALALNDAIMYRCYSWYGIDIGDKQVRFWGVPVVAKLRRKEMLKDFVLNRIRISAFDISESSCLKKYERIKKFRPDYFYGYTTAIYGFCMFMQKLGIDLNSLNLKAVICTAEKMYTHHVSLFRQVFDCPVVDEYGSSENGILAFQCREGNMHMMSDQMCTEFLDEHDRQVGPGELGRIVVTDLVSYAMPLIRYDIGDMGRPSDKKCTCGINLPLMEIIEGRKEDFIRTKEGKLVHAAYLCYTLKDDTVNEFKMYQEDINTLSVRIVKSAKFNPGTEKMLGKKLRTALGKDMKINFEYVERIPREASGKLRYFVSGISNE